MRLVRSHPAVRAVVVLGLTLVVLALGAIVLPPRGSRAMPRNSSAPQSWRR
ncbi:MAG TPA: hypothetical protein VMG31_17455 [Verrucomicrobiae bacterium]|nr:hypothetical protein [Verrucomicrobiae bacterium]